MDALWDWSQKSKGGRDKNALGTNWRRVRCGDESFQQQRAPPIPGVLWARPAAQPGPALQLRVVVQGLALLSAQVEPAAVSLALHTQNRQNRLASWIYVSHFIEQITLDKSGVETKLILAWPVSRNLPQSA